MAGMYEQFDLKGYPSLLRKLARGEYISPDQLADALTHNRGKPVPDELLDYLVRTLRAEIKRPRGRKPISPLHQALLELAQVYYERFYAWLKNREKTQGLEGSKYVQQANWWQGPPHERAARMTARRIRRNVDYRYILNFIVNAGVIM